MFLAVRITLGLIALFGIAVLPPNTEAGAAAITGGWHNLWTAWKQWDAGWFLQIATDGYTVGGGSAAFFPGYPLAIRAFSVLTGGNALAASLVVSHVAFLGSLVVVYLMSLREMGEAIARRTVLYLSVFPTALFFFAPYSESLFLLFSATCLYAARRGNFGVAAIAGALASASRSIGIILVIPMLIEAFTRYSSQSEKRGRNLPWMIGCSCFVLVGAVLYGLYWGNLTGDWLMPLHEQGNWQREFHMPYETLRGATIEAWRWIGLNPGGYHLLDWLVVMPMLACGVWVVWRASLSYSVYTWLSLLVPLSFVFGGRPLMSLSRFILMIVPLFWALAYAGTRWGLHELIVGASAAGLGVMTLLYVNGYWIF